MLEFSVDGGIVTIRSTILIPAECATEVAIRGTLFAKGRTELCSLLKENLDIFAWHPSDMTGVPRSIAEHRLNILEGCGNFNKSSRKDCYPLPEIDWKVESLCGYPFKCFLDAYKGYHQIQMAESDEEKTAFHTSHGRNFQTHLFAVLPTKAESMTIISRPDVAGRLQKWSVMLGEYNITYRPRTSVKGQILADFLIEKPDESTPDTSVVETPQERDTTSRMDHHV
ncbi:hypothetical protein Tco_0532114 [Tanacetum coccineum]